MLSQSVSEWLESLGKVGSICHFPVRNDGAAKQEGHAAVSIAIDSKDPGKVELARLYAAWALLLRLYTGSERVAFVGATETSASEVWVKPVVVNVEAEMLISDVGKQIGLPERRDIAPTGDAQDTWRAISQAEAACNTIIISGSHLGVSERSNLHNKVFLAIFSCVLLFHSNCSPVSHHHLLKTIATRNFLSPKPPIAFTGGQSCWSSQSCYTCRSRAVHAKAKHSQSGTKGAVGPCAVLERRSSSTRTFSHP